MPNIIKEEFPIQESGYKIHCFPDIFDGYSSKNRDIARNIKSFKRIDFGNAKSVRDLTNNPEKSGAFNDAFDEDVSDVEKLAYIQGFKKGEKEGIESGKKKMEPVLNNFRQVLSELDRIKKESSLMAEKEAVDLSMAIARKIVCHEIATNKETVLCVVKEALKKIVDSDKILIKINSADIQYVKDHEIRFAELFDNIENIEFEPDDTVPSGGCVIKTNSGDIDARLEKQLQAIEEAFKTELQEAGAGSL
ncbi:MAG: FliH/SctL family protein [Thermodesulfobacteriota bacterium]|nr:FliH/SctL family protein [Thermodesulfobacteriota bacterium]